MRYGEKSVREPGGFLDSSEEWEFRGGSSSEIYNWLQKELLEWEYLSRGKKERGVIRKYLEKMTGVSASQMTRLIAQYRCDGRIERRTAARNRFALKYTRQDIALPAEADVAHERLSGPATRRILRREWKVFGKTEYERLAGISSSHLYNLRGSGAYRKQAGQWEATRSSRIRDRRTEAAGSAGPARVSARGYGTSGRSRETEGRVSHQLRGCGNEMGDRRLGCTEKISERYLTRSEELSEGGDQFREAGRDREPNERHRVREECGSSRANC